MPAVRLPPALPREGAFAASGTNVAMHGRHAWIGTDRGARAAVVRRRGDVEGRGDAARDESHRGDLLDRISRRTARRRRRRRLPEGDRRRSTTPRSRSDGGATWTLVKDRGLSGFRSVVAWVPGSERSLIAIGPSGADWSSDDGRTWTPIRSEGFDTFSFVPGRSLGWAAGQGGRIAKLTLSAVIGRDASAFLETAQP